MGAAQALSLQTLDLRWTFHIGFSTRSGASMGLRFSVSDRNDRSGPEPFDAGLKIHVGFRDDPLNRSSPR